MLKYLKQRLTILGFLAIALGTWGSAAQGAAISLVEVDRFNVGAPFGLAYDGTNLWFGRSSGDLEEITTSGVLTGNTTPQVGGWSALAWDSGKGQLASASNLTVTYFDRFTGGNQSTLGLDPSANLLGISLIDGLDIDHNEIWYSRDVDFVNRYDSTGSVIPPDPFLGGAGGYSGVERVDIGADTFIIVVNDASSPRELCVHDLTGLELGCTALVNSRFEDLAFDGRHLYAADYFGTDIVKIDVLADGGSIFDPNGQVPEPATLALFSVGLAGLGFAARRRKAA